MKSQQLKSKEYFIGLRFIYYALLAGQMILGLVSYFLIFTGVFEPPQKDMQVIYLCIAAMFIAGSIVGGQALFKNVMKAAKEKATLSVKMLDYRSATIMRLILLEGSSFFTVSGYILTGNILFLGMTIVVILLFISLIPTEKKAIIDMELGPNETEAINDPDRIITEVDR